MGAPGRGLFVTVSVRYKAQIGKQLASKEAALAKAAAQLGFKETITYTFEGPPRPAPRSACLAPPRLAAHRRYHCHD